MTEYFDSEKLIELVNTAKAVLRDQIQKIIDFEDAHPEVDSNHLSILYVERGGFDVVGIDVDEWNRLIGIVRFSGWERNPEEAYEISETLAETTITDYKNKIGSMVERRLQREADAKAKGEAQEKAEYERLKQKFEGR